MATAELNVRRPDRIDVHTNFNERELVKRIPGSSYRGEEKIWTVPRTWTACIQLRGIFGAGLTVGPELVKWAQYERESRVDPAMRVRDLIEPSYRLDESLYAFQEADTEFIALAGSSALLGNEMGTGKTISALKSITLPALVICPNSTKHNWADEAAKWLPTATVYISTGSLLQRRKILADAKKDPHALVIINMEGVRGHSRLAGYGSVHLKRCVKCDPKLGDPKLTEVRCEVHAKELNGFGFKTVIFDEAHRMKDPKSLQTRAAWAVAHDPSVVRRLALTGTPIANDPSDLWSIMHFLAPDEFPTKSKFVDRYCLMSWNAYGGLSVVGVNPDTRREFDAVLNPRFRRMTKDLIRLQLPPKIRSIVKVDMTVKQGKAYREIENSLVTRLDDGQLLIAPSNLSAQIRLAQFAATYCEINRIEQKLTVLSECPCYGQSLDAHHDACLLKYKTEVTLCEPSPKIDALEEIIASAGGKRLVVCAEQRQLIELAAKRLTKSGVKFGLITGKIDEWDRKQALKDLNDGRIQVLLFTIKAGGTGLNMTAADTIVFLQRSWSMVDNRQAEDRVHRIGSEQHEAIQIIDIISDGTIEVTQLERYVEKLQRLDEITRDRDRLRSAGLATTELDALEELILNSDLGRPTR